MGTVELRLITDDDVDALFEMMRDRDAIWMAAFTPDDPDDRAAFEARLTRVRTAPDITIRAVTWDGRLVGSIASFPMDRETEVTYWIDRSAWGNGIASEALAQLVELVPVRPLHARAASDNPGSLRVLAKAGFQVTGTEHSYAKGRDAVIEETILRLA